MVVDPVPPPPAEVLVAGRSAIATMTQSVLVAVVYVSVIVPDVVAILKLAPPKNEVVALFHKVVWLDVASEEVKLPPPPPEPVTSGLKIARAAAYASLVVVVYQATVEEAALVVASSVASRSNKLLSVSVWRIT
jgi:hypothetical protein